MARSPALDRARQNATGIASTLVTGIWLAALLTGQDWWLGALIFGYVVVVPIVALLYGDEEDREEWWNDGSDDATADRDATTVRTDDDAALERLRRRYAEGELTDEQFERKLERLLETETLEDVEDRIGGVERSARGGGDREREREPGERERERETERF